MKIRTNWDILYDIEINKLLRLMTQREGTPIITLRFHPSVAPRCLSNNFILHRIANSFFFEKINHDNQYTIDR